MVDAQMRRFKNSWSEKNNFFLLPVVKTSLCEAISSKRVDRFGCSKNPWSQFLKLYNWKKNDGFYEKISCVVAAESMTWSTEKFDSKSEASMP